VQRPIVLLVSDDREFAETTSRCLAANPPVFVFRNSEDCRLEKFDLAIVGGLRCAADSVLGTLRAAGKPVIHVAVLNEITPKVAGVVAIPEIPGWAELLAVVVQAILSREIAHAEVRKLVDSTARLEREALLGRYMIEAWHNLSNALTSILGNADLILLDEEQLSPAIKGQVETIRNMSMRVNEIMQRFSSLQKEMQLIERQKKGTAKSAAAGA
jgi:signal transduction histidine kinase